MPVWVRPGLMSNTPYVLRGVKRYLGEISFYNWTFALGLPGFQVRYAFTRGYVGLVSCRFFHFFA